MFLYYIINFVLCVCGGGCGVCGGACVCVYLHQFNNKKGGSQTTSLICFYNHLLLVQLLYIW